MKTVLIVLLIIPCWVFSQIRTISFSDLERLRKEHPKPVIIHLYTDWCTVCTMECFELTKDEKLVKALNEGFYFMSFEAEKTKETIRFQGKDFHYIANGKSGIHEFALALSRNKSQPVYPLWVFLDQDFNLLDYHEGFLSPSGLRNKLKEIPEAYSGSEAKP
ncbi:MULTISPECIES: thiol:disulfide interchange protein [Chryseobacterium]|uniref:Thioredoxin-related protein n=1 Tax=Chryseobacterium camelliae TaxID=1265445 RepID=A0ABU0TJM8_9FLAO|nr:MULTISPECIES: thiol:disulfide interchange protein [Chryseobacterium]MDT3408891.1 thioredoxin-related protein [Pseudacidovorax intermedius]MDQ1097252.1 thioredoxin-related protein [Chryseobacterium camelliae]MDQ1101187.1 thioredoxin-related protein [Chryseobacterium sp. SORGH_AS_1048]MDR6084632.1 thioredoxin-related protein [Chryseobacterium sp. SORGH_AS_0909]MDR6132904.1 thioredoxin-related protein [Chryseobacterium sp. SORGH_AS_1175]